MDRCSHRHRPLEAPLADAFGSAHPDCLMSGLAQVAVVALIALAALVLAPVAIVWAG
jgi:hypothetical protein